MNRTQAKIETLSCIDSGYQPNRCLSIAAPVNAAMVMDAAETVVNSASDRRLVVQSPTERAGVIAPVHCAGMPREVDRIFATAGTRVVEDAVQGSTAICLATAASPYATPF
jgi:dTDP-4-amino-4,6-dideoxygalactose transaminase